LKPRASFGFRRTGRRFALSLHRSQLPFTNRLATATRPAVAGTLLTSLR